MEDCDLGYLPFTREDWIAASLDRVEARRVPARWEAAALAHLPELARRIGLPRHCGDWRPGMIIWWPESESGYVTAVGHCQGTSSALALIDRQTGFWRLRCIVGLRHERRIYRASGLTVTALVALRLGTAPAEAAGRLGRWFAQSHRRAA